MSDQLSQLQAEVQRLSRLVHELDRRLAALEGRSPAVAGTGAATPVGAEPAARAPAPESLDWTAVVSKLGRTLIVLGGAYLLRAMTESGALRPSLGVALGLGYALAWIVAAARSRGAHRGVDAMFHGTAATLIGFPLVVEATLRFGLLSPQAGALVLGSVTVIWLGVAWRRQLRVLAWLTAAGGLLTGIALMTRTGVVAPYAVYFVLLGIAALWLGYDREWKLLRWPTAAIADFVVAGLTVRAVTPQAQQSPNVALAIQMLLLGGYLGSIAVRTLVRGRNVLPFEVVQSAMALLVGLGGAIVVTRTTGAGATLLGWFLLLLAVLSYVVAFMFVDRRQGRGTNFYFYTALALVFALVGSAVLWSEPWLSLLWSGFALATAWAGWRYSRAALALHAAAYLAAAAISSGLLAGAALGLVGGMPLAASAIPASAFVVLAIAAACASLPATTESTEWEQVAPLPRLAIVLVLVWGLGGAIVLGLASALGLTQDGPEIAGAVATIRTAVLSVAALLVAWLGRFDRLAVFGWLMYPVLVLTGVKLVAEDLRYSRAATLFLAFALYGAALVLAPRLRRRDVS